MTITQEQFDSLLTWLGNDRDVAGRKYEAIRSRLVRIFVARGFSDAEDLADETINRVMIRLPYIRDTYEGEPACYFHGVAKNVLRESTRRKEIVGGFIDGSVVPEAEPSEEYVCLGHCLNGLPANKRDLVLDYYLYEGHEKIEHHKQMAGQLKISEAAFRSRVYQIRMNLQNCLRKCALRKKGLRCGRCQSTGHSDKGTTHWPNYREREEVA